MFFDNPFVHSHQISLLSYLGVGVAICIYPLYEAIENINFRMNHEMIQILNDEPPLLERILTPIIYALGFVLFTCFWPFTAAYMFSQYVKSRKDDKLFNESRFYFRMEYLGDEVDMNQLEKKYIISDPLGLTPSLPFGHLYPAWTIFLNSCTKKDKLYHFYIPRGSVTNHFKERAKSDIRGFVKIRGKQIIDEFLIEGNISN